MATSINQVVSSETSVGGGVYAPVRRAGTSADDNAPSTASAPLRRLRGGIQDLGEVFLIGIRQPYRGALDKLMVMLAPYQEQLAKAAHKVQVETSRTGYKRHTTRKPFSAPSFWGRGLLKALVR